MNESLRPKCSDGQWHRLDTVQITVNKARPGARKIPGRFQVVADCKWPFAVHTPTRRLDDGSFIVDTAGSNVNLTHLPTGRTVVGGVPRPVARMLADKLIEQVPEFAVITTIKQWRSRPKLRRQIEEIIS